MITIFIMIMIIIFIKGDWSCQWRPPASAPLAPIPPPRQAGHCYQVPQKTAILQIKKCAISLIFFSQFPEKMQHFRKAHSTRASNIIYPANILVQYYQNAKENNKPNTQCNTDFVKFSCFTKGVNGIL